MGVIIGCSGAKNLAKAVAKKSKLSYSDLIVEKFPDGELKVRFKSSVKGKTIIFIQSYFPAVNDKLTEMLLVAHTAKELKSKKLILMALYFPYLREDKRFEKHESISAKIIAKFHKIFDKVFIVEPHLHRFKRLRAFFPNTEKISTTKEISAYIKKNFKDFVLIGPDQESAQWVEPIADILKTKSIILKKKRLTPEKVKISNIKAEKKKVKTAIIIDDIISTGGTMLEAAKEAKKLAKQVCFIGIHGIFAKNALNKLKKIGIVVSTNSIPSAASKIDLSDAVAAAIKKLK
ncbi:MAG: ribose-phosphate diphosphokinase [Candidatus Pacearchaeota archaeon]|nr:MAG: ribose-phosphate diphosphokinase [Candidatus Pacearchaeota archaeon]